MRAALAASLPILGSLGRWLNPSRRSATSKFAGLPVRMKLIVLSLLLLACIGLCCLPVRHRISADCVLMPLTFSSGPDIVLLPLIERMRQQPIESLVIVANSVDAALLCQQVRKSGWQIPLALADWAATEQLISLGGKAVEGAVVSQYFNRKSTAPDYLDFKREFEKAYRSEPGFGALHAYNATMLVLRSLAEKQDGETLKQTILRISQFKGLQDDIVINRFGDSNHPTYMGIIENGTFRIFEDYR